jgi:hypothetical protein
MERIRDAAVVARILNKWMNHLGLTETRIVDKCHGQIGIHFIGNLNRRHMVKEPEKVRIVIKALGITEDQFFAGPGSPKPEPVHSPVTPPPDHRMHPATLSILVEALALVEFFSLHYKAESQECIVLDPLTRCVARTLGSLEPGQFAEVRPQVLDAVQRLEASAQRVARQAAGHS